MMQRDGQTRIVTVEMIVINESAVYKLAFRSNKPKADAFTTWVAGEVMPSIRKTGFYSAKRATKYVAEGKSGEWIEKRVEGIETRKGFTDVLKDHAVEGGGYGQCTNAIYKPILGSGAAHQKIIRQLKPKANLRDSLSTSELIRVQFAESLAADRIEKERVAGNGPCEKVCGLSGKAVAEAIRIATEEPLDGGPK